MQDNGTVQQLSKALNQLLDAYEILQEESKNLKEENQLLQEEVDDLELRNRGLDSRLSTLNDTTKQNSDEMGTMLGRIENILGPKEIEAEEGYSEEIEEEVNQFEKNDTIIEENTTSVEKEEQKVNSNQNDNQEIDLGRMQSLLNGFGNN